MKAGLKLKNRQKLIDELIQKRFWEMETRSHVIKKEYSVNQDNLFKSLHTPSHIRVWWGASRVIVLPEPGGIWVAAWGEEEDNPDYINCFAIREFEPPVRMLLTDAKYFAKEGQPPFKLEMTTEFVVKSKGPESSTLMVVQDGFPREPAADEFYNACAVGWEKTLNALGNYLSHL
jgi:uncharacterized protein YndB with AHSA1/START domain